MRGVAVGQRLGLHFDLTDEKLAGCAVLGFGRSVKAFRRLQPWTAAGLRIGQEIFFFDPKAIELAHANLSSVVPSRPRRLRDLISIPETGERPGRH